MLARGLPVRVATCAVVRGCAIPDDGPHAPRWETRPYLPDLELDAPVLVRRALRALVRCVRFGAAGYSST